MVKKTFTAKHKQTGVWKDFKYTSQKEAIQHNPDFNEWRELQMKQNITDKIIILNIKEIDTLLTAMDHLIKFQQDNVDHSVLIKKLQSEVKKNE